VAEPLLALARERAAGLPQAGFRLGDATRTGLAGGSFDAVICVFGVFFVPDMPAFAATAPPPTPSPPPSRPGSATGSSRNSGHAA